jgi:hypothetical protein
MNRNYQFEQCLEKTLKQVKKIQKQNRACETIMKDVRSFRISNIDISLIFQKERRKKEESLEKFLKIMTENS